MVTMMILNTFGWQHSTEVKNTNVEEETVTQIMQILIEQSSTGKLAKLEFQPHVSF